MNCPALSDHDWLNAAAVQPDTTVAGEAEQRQSQLTKPRGSLGQLEALAIRLAALQRNSLPAVEQISISIFAADHGIAAEGMSAYPQEVTAQMIANFASGGAAVAVLAKHLQAQFEVVNLGTVAAVPFSEGVVERQIAPMTASFSQQAAMTEQQLRQALAVGAERVDHAAGQQAELFIAGEMGIGNTSSAAAIAAVLLERPAVELTGPGTGLSASQVQAKAVRLQQAIELHRCAAADPQQVLRTFGGFEIAAMAGAYLRCGQRGIPVLVDGFISSVAALVACRIQPALRAWLLFAHQSAEPGHRLVLEALEADPLLDLNMRLGEGSGAVLAVDLLRSACRLHSGMATFAEAGVSDKAE